MLKNYRDGAFSRVHCIGEEHGYFGNAEIADSGNIVSCGFCPTCGAPVLKKSAGFPSMLFFHAATLDNPAVFKPQKVFWTASHQSWDYVDPDLERKEFS